MVTPNFRRSNIALGLVFMLVSGCVEVTTRPSISSEDTKMIVDALIQDLPLPPNATIRKRESVILGSGYGWG